jgi:hypothetical protein
MVEGPIPARHFRLRDSKSAEIRVIGSATLTEGQYLRHAGGGAPPGNRALNPPAVRLAALCRWT